MVWRPFLLRPGGSRSACLGTPANSHERVILSVGYKLWRAILFGHFPSIAISLWHFTNRQQRPLLVEVLNGTLVASLPEYLQTGLKARHAWNVRYNKLGAPFFRLPSGHRINWICRRNTSPLARPVAELLASLATGFFFAPGLSTIRTTPT